MMPADNVAQECEFDIPRIINHAINLAATVRRCCPIKGQAFPYAPHSCSEATALGQCTRAAYELRIALDPNQVCRSRTLDEVRFDILGLARRGRKGECTQLLRLWETYKNYYDGRFDVDLDESHESRLPEFEEAEVAALEEAAAHLEALNAQNVDLERGEATTETRATAPEAEKPDQLDDIDDSSRADTDVASHELSDQFVFARSGDGFYIEGFGERGHVKNLKGFRQIQRLIDKPGKPVPMLELMELAGDLTLSQDNRSYQASLDPEAYAAISQRLQEAQTELDFEREENATVDVAHCEEEVARIKAELNRATNKWGKPRDLNSRYSSLRSSIHGSLQRAFTKLQKAQPPMNRLANHFNQNISSSEGIFRYSPEGTPPNWSFFAPSNDEVALTNE
jgi:hypothetical protein